MLYSSKATNSFLFALLLVSLLSLLETGELRVITLYLAILLASFLKDGLSLLQVIVRKIAHKVSQT